MTKTNETKTKTSRNGGKGRARRVAQKKKTDGDAVDLDDVRVRIKKVEKELGTAIMEREDPIHGLWLALLTRHHVLLLGPPGTGKSMLTSLSTAVLQGSELFDVVLSKTTKDDALLGMLDPSKFPRGLYERIDFGGTIRSAHLAFLDEIFKCNSTVLNVLLPILNERRFRNGTAGMVDLPLVSCVGVSNEYPQGDELAALYDRFIFRYWISYLQEEANWLNLLTSGARVSPTTSLTLAELEAAQKAVEQVKVPKQLGAVLLKIRSALGNVGIIRSDRRWFQCMEIVRAEAWLAGRDQVDKSDLLILKDVLWDNYQDEGRKVEEVLLDICAPKLKELMAIVDLCFEQVRTLKEYARSQDVTLRQITEAKTKFSELADQARKLIPDAGPKGAEQEAKLDAWEAEAVKLHAGAVWE